jgi:hypothetical protein
MRSGLVTLCYTGTKAHASLILASVTELVEI